MDQSSSSAPSEPQSPSQEQQHSPQHIDIEESRSFASVSSWILGGSPAHRKSVLLTSANHNIIHSLHSPFARQDLVDEPELHYIRLLVISLLVTTSLACVAGFDAKVQCRSRRVYDTLFDDDTVIFNMMQRMQEEHACVNMFRYVMLPVTFSTLTAGSIALYWIRKHASEIQLTTLERQRAHYHVILLLVISAAVFLIAWTCGIVFIMLRPRNLQNTNNNPYQTLAAVDAMGHVGDNANLYYLAWISMGLVVAIVYQVSVECVRQAEILKDLKQRQGQPQENVEAMLSYTTSQWQLYREQRDTWYNSLYRLRIRSGIWVSALLATTVVLASSLLLWRDVLAPAASRSSGAELHFRGVCLALAKSENNSTLPPELCARTALSICSGGTAVVLCLVAIVIHIGARRDAAAHVMDDSCSPVLSVQHYAHHFHSTSPLRTEFVLSLLLSTLLGLNAVFGTGVQGPAASVGNLYYASWASVLLCLRITLGCLEEMYNLNKEKEEEGMEMTLVMKKSGSNSSGNATASHTPEPSSSISSDAGTMDLFDNERARRLRRYLFLGIFSTICSASALDAAFNQSDDLTWDQRYVIIAPMVIALLCIIQFALCLDPITDLWVSHVCIGGSLSVLMFYIWLVDLILTMHSKNSWAVNAIGDIKIANLYYFSWASIVMAGVHMMTFFKKLIGTKEKEFVTVMWMAMVKVCFVIMGAGFHIWHTISGSCTLENIQSGAVDFCSRTVFAIIVSLTGMTVGGSVALTRIVLRVCCPRLVTRRIRSHVEMILSVFLFLLFGVAVALITGIGGPGQSVGDLYYATWLAFLVSIGIGYACYAEIKKDEQLDTNASWQEHDEEDDVSRLTKEELETNFVQMT